MAADKKGGRWLSYRVRTCYSVHGCALCGGDIKLGERYYDGGYERRAHEDCVLGASFAQLARDLESDIAARKSG